MLFTYSPLSLAQNWLSSVMVQILNQGMQAIMGGAGAPSWPAVIPNAYRDELQDRSGIKTRLQHFWVMFSSITPAEQVALLQALSQQTNLPDILFNDAACTGINIFPNKTKDAVVDLFRFLFEKQLTTLKINNKSLRDIHYSVIYDNFPSRICPFCGIGHFRAPGAPRNALDHYMPITKYPFAGVDLRNLPPMCSECNSDFKKDIDILTDNAGLRKRSIDPYNGPVFSISLADSVPGAGPIKQAIKLPLWKIDFVGGPKEQAENWDRVFKIRQRYERDILNVEYRSWLEHFAKWYQGNHGANVDQDKLLDSIDKYIYTVIQDNLSDRAFLKAEVFRLLATECADINRGDDIRAFLEILIANA